jgi:Ca2+-binding EF-hand superfamily protein
LCHDVNGEIPEDDTSDASDYPDSADPGAQYEEHDEFSGNEMDFENFTKLSKKMDADGDGKVTSAELRKWIEHVSHKSAQHHAHLKWTDLLADVRREESPTVDTITWDLYKTALISKENADDKALLREQTRWKAADADGDGRLSQAEFVALVHPELFAHMEKTLVEETLEDMDKNHNGRIERDEFLDDVLKQEADGEFGQDASDSEWLQSEREHFDTQYDRNRDGSLDYDEILLLLRPEASGHQDEEVAHLMSSADADKDGVLSMDEILSDKGREAFGSSLATDFGEAAHYHDEL